MKKLADNLRTLAISIGIFIILFCVVDVIYWFVDLPSDIDRIDLITTCLIRQSILISLLVICEIVGLIRYLKGKRSKE